MSLDIPLMRGSFGDHLHYAGWQDLLNFEWGHGRQG